MPQVLVRSRQVPDGAAGEILLSDRVFYPLVMSTIAIENGDSEWNYPLKMVLYHDFTIVMLNYQRVNAKTTYHSCIVVLCHIFAVLLFPIPCQCQNFSEREFTRSVVLLVSDILEIDHPAVQA